MRQDFDFVLMENYEKDTRDLVSIASATNERLIRERDEARAMFAAAVRTMGRVEISRQYLYDINANKYCVTHLYDCDKIVCSFDSRKE